MQLNSDPKHPESNASVVMGASSVEDSMKSRILERIKAQMAEDSLDREPGIPPIYLKAPDWPNWP